MQDFLEELDHDKSNINVSRVEKISAAWIKAACISNMRQTLSQDSLVFDPNRPDYPLTMNPLGNHPLYARVPDDKKNELLLCAWLAMNRRIITIEDNLIRPTAEIIAHPDMPGSATIETIMRQTAIDEEYHSLLHLGAMQKARRDRNYQRQWEVPIPITLRRVNELIADQSENWQKALTKIVFATVAEVSFSTFLDAFAQNKEIQPYNRTVLEVHTRDEARHGAVFHECSKALCSAMSDKYRDFFIDLFPTAIRAFLAEDWLSWNAMVSHVDLPGGQQMLSDVRAVTEDRTDLIITEFGPVKRLLTEMGIIDRVNFDFGRPNTNPVQANDASTCRM